MACSPVVLVPQDYSGGQGKRVAWGQEYMATLGNTVRSCLKTNSNPWVDMQDSSSILRTACNLKIRKGLLLGSYNILRPQVLEIETTILPNYQSNHRFFKHKKTPTIFSALSSETSQLTISQSVGWLQLLTPFYWWCWVLKQNLRHGPRKQVYTEPPTADCNFNMWQHRSSGHWKCYLGDLQWQLMAAS